MHTKSSVLAYILLPIAATPFLELAVMKVGLSEDVSRILNGSLYLIVYLTTLVLFQRKTFMHVMFEIYVVLQALHGYYNGASFAAIYYTAVLWLIASRVFEISRNLSFDDLRRIVIITSIFTLTASIAASEINYLINGNLLPLLYQDVIVIIIFSLLVQIWISRNILQKNKLRLATVLALVYLPLLLLRFGDNAVAQYQFKTLIMIPVVIIIFIIIKNQAFNRSIKRYKKIKILLTASVICIMASFIYLSILGEIVSSFGRSNSYVVRMAVNNAMYDRVSSELSSFVWGLGLGTSAGYHDITEFYAAPANIEARAHSGLFIYFYEQGILGLVIFYLFVSNFFKGFNIKARLRPVYQWRTGDIKAASQITSNRRAFFLLLATIVLWFSSNLFIISALPGPDPFWQGGLIIYAYTFILICRLYFFKKQKNAYGFVV